MGVFGGWGMKAGWQLRTLGTLCRIRTGKKDVNQGNPEGAFPFFTCAANHTFSDSYSFDTEALLIAGNGDVGNVSYYNGKFEAYQRTYVLSDFSDVLPRFLYLILDGKLKETISKQKLGNTMPYIKVGMLTDFELPVPPLPEQQRIVTLLDEAFDGIATARAHAEKNLQNARAIFESQREVLLSVKQGWLEAPLADLCDVKHGYAFEGEFFAPEGDYVLLTPGSFFESGGYRARGEKTKFFVGKIPNDYILKMGDLLVAMTEQAAGLLGSPLLVPDSNRFLHNQRLGLVTGKSGVPWLNEFFFHVFNLRRVRHAIHASSSGVKVRHTSPSKIGAVQVAYPKSVAEQNCITSQLGELLSECQHLESIYQQKLTAIDALKKSLLHRAFSGNL
jgi:type I restriction enzyme S subunit